MRGAVIILVSLIVALGVMEYGRRIGGKGGWAEWAFRRKF